MAGIAPDLVLFQPEPVSSQLARLNHQLELKRRTIRYLRGLLQTCHERLLSGTDDDRALAAELEPELDGL